MCNCLLQVFRDDSAASFYHAYRIIECLLRCFPAEVFDGICGDGEGDVRVAAMLRYIGYAPVGEMVVMIVALTPVPRMTQQYISSSKNRWIFFEQLSNWIFLLRLTEVIVGAEKICFLSDGIDAEQHSASASQVLLELIEKLSLEDTGELLLQPLGYTTELLDLLLDKAMDTSSGPCQRRYSARMMCFLLRRAAEPEIMCMMSSAPNSPPAPALVPNRIFPLRERILEHLETRTMALIGAILASAEDTTSSSIYSPPTAPPAVAATVSTTAVDGDGESGVGCDSVSEVSAAASTAAVTAVGVVEPIVFSGFTVTRPFTAMRALLVELLALLVESDECVGNSFPLELWLKLMLWTVEYPHNNIYHSFFFRIVFAILR